jgi:hypothetical protein
MYRLIKIEETSVDRNNELRTFSQANDISPPPLKSSFY